MTSVTVYIRIALLVCTSAGTVTAEEIAPVPSEDSVEAIQLQVEEGLSLASAPRAAIVEYYYAYRRFPANNAYAGLLEPYEMQGKYISSVAVANGVITITYGRNADPAISGRTVRYVPSIVDDRIEWACLSDFIEDRYLPDACTAP